MALSDLPELVELADRLVQVARDIIDAHDDPGGWVAQAITGWEAAVERIRDGIHEPNPTQVKRGLSLLLLTSSRVQNASGWFRPYLKSDPARRQLYERLHHLAHQIEWDDLYRNRGNLDGLAEQLIGVRHLLDPTETF